MNKIKNLNLIVGTLAISGIAIDSTVSAVANDGELFNTNQSTSTSDKYEINWNKKIGDTKEDKFYKVLPTKDGGVIAVGQTALTPTTGFTTGDAIIVKFAEDGTEEWRDVLEGDETDRYYSVVALENGDFLALGVSYSTNIGFNNANRKGHAIIAHFTSDGTRSFVTGYTDGASTLAYTHAVLLPDGAVYAACGEIKPNVGGSAIDKDTIVSKNFQKITLINNRSVNREIIKSKHMQEKSQASEIIVGDMINTSDNKILITGQEYLVNDSDIINHFLLKIDEEGEKIWETEAEDCGPIKSNAMIESADGSIYIAGEALSFADNPTSDAMLLKFDAATGDGQWATYINGENYDTFNAIDVNSNGDIVVVGHSNSVLPNTTITENKTEVIMAKFNKEQGTMLDIANLGADTQGLVVYSSFIDENDELIIAGKKGFANGNDACDLINPCVQYDAVLLSVKEKLKGTPNDCTVVPITLTNSEVTLNLGDRLNVLNYINAPADFDKTKFEIVTTLSKDDRGYYAEKAGTYEILIKYINNCGSPQTLKLNAIFKDVSCPINPPVVTAKDDNIHTLGENFDPMKLVTLTGMDIAKVKDSKTETNNGLTTITTIYESGDKIVVSHNVDVNKEGSYSVAYTLTNKCGETAKEIKVHVKAKTTQGGTNNNGTNNNGTNNNGTNNGTNQDVNNNNTTTDKPQTGDNALVYAGLAGASVIGLVAINSKKRKTDSEDENNDSEDEF